MVGQIRLWEGGRGGHPATLLLLQGQHQLVWGWCHCFYQHSGIGRGEKTWVCNSTEAGVADTQKKNPFLCRSTPLMQLLKPQAFSICKKVQICMTDCILIKVFKQSLFHSVSDVSVKLAVRTYQNLTTARAGWVTSNEFSYICTGLFCFKNSLSVCVASYLVASIFFKTLRLMYVSSENY